MQSLSTRSTGTGLSSGLRVTRVTFGSGPRTSPEESKLPLRTDRAAVNDSESTDANFADTVDPESDTDSCSV